MTVFAAAFQAHGTRPVKLSITHNFRPDDSTQPDVSEA
jgi:hypothetical protein